MGKTTVGGKPGGAAKSPIQIPDSYFSRLKKYPTTVKIPANGVGYLTAHLSGSLDRSVTASTMRFIVGTNGEELTADVSTSDTGSSHIVYKIKNDNSALVEAVLYYC